MWKPAQKRNTKLTEKLHARLEGTIKTCFFVLCVQRDHSLSSLNLITTLTLLIQRMLEIGILGSQRTSGFTVGSREVLRHGNYTLQDTIDRCAAAGFLFRPLAWSREGRMVWSFHSTMAQLGSLWHARWRSLRPLDSSRSAREVSAFESPCFWNMARLVWSKPFCWSSKQSRPML